MRNDFALFGLFIPNLLSCFVLGAVLWFVVDAIMLRTGAWNYFWHPPFARLALYVVSVALFVALYPDFGQP
ncbi:DUF1656 domain-containing protein [Thioclava sp. BHET1]|nr:DUF1656 domain-containing protein [Thioclava sp. BHET1]